MQTRRHSLPPWLCGPLVGFHQPHLSRLRSGILQVSSVLVLQGAIGDPSGPDTLLDVSACDCQNGQYARQTCVNRHACMHLEQLMQKATKLFLGQNRIWCQHQVGESNTVMD